MPKKKKQYKIKKKNFNIQCRLNKNTKQINLKKK